MKKILLFAAIVFGIFLSNAQAQDRVFAAITGHGFEDIYNFGFGLRVGKNFTFFEIPFLYLGGVGIYHQGKTQNQEFPTATGREIVKTTNNISFAGGEVGININTSILTFRPSVFLAYARINLDIPELDTNGRFISLREENNTEFFVGPGLNVAIPFGNLSVGGDIRYLDVKGAESWAAYSTLTFRF